MLCLAGMPGRAYPFSVALYRLRPASLHANQINGNESCTTLLLRQTPLGVHNAGGVLAHDLSAISNATSVGRTGIG